jgi:hypothetical protein
LGRWEIHARRGSSKPIKMARSPRILLYLSVSFHGFVQLLIKSILDTYYLISLVYNLAKVEVNAVPPVYQNDKITERKEDSVFEEEGHLKTGEVHDAFGNEENAEIKYKTLKWWYVCMQ